MIRWFDFLSKYTGPQRWWTNEAPWNSRVSNSCLSTLLCICMCTANLADANEHIFDWAILGMNYSSEQLVKMFMNIYHSSVALLSKPPPFSPKHPATILLNHPIWVYHHFSWSISSNSCWFVKITHHSNAKKHLLLHKKNNIHHFPNIQTWPSWNMLWSPIFTSPLLMLWHSQSLIIQKKCWLAMFLFFSQKNCTGLVSTPPAGWGWLIFPWYTHHLHDIWGCGTPNTLK